MVNGVVFFAVSPLPPLPPSYFTLRFPLRRIERYKSNHGFFSSIQIGQSAIEAYLTAFQSKNFDPLPIVASAFVSQISTLN